MKKLLVLALLLAACRRTEWDAGELQEVRTERIEEHPNVTVTAPKELVFAMLIVDGDKPRGMWPDALIDHPRWWAIRGFLGRTPEASFAKSRLRLPPGRHVLRIEHAEYAPIVITLDVGTAHADVRVEESKLVRKLP